MERQEPKSRQLASGTLGVLWLALATLWLTRGIAPLSQSMYAWGLNLHRFVPPWAGWTPWLVGMLALFPTIGRRLTRVVDGPRGLLATRVSGLFFTLSCGVMAFLLPDRTWLTGDFLLRQGTSETGGFEGTFANALPVEVLINRWLPLLVRPGSGLDPNLATRLLESALAVSLACCAIALSNTWGLRGLSRTTSVAVIAFGGYLATFTGLGKPTALMCVLSALSLLSATRLLNSGRSGLLFGASLALALLTHRSAVTLLPLAGLVMLMALSASRRRLVPPMQLAAAIVPPAIACMLIGPRIAQILVSFDLPRHVAPTATHGSGLLAAALVPLRLLDLANVLIVLVPALPFALLAAALDRHRSPGENSGLVVWVLALSSLPVFLFVHPIQGIFRDLEVFAPAGLALSVWSAQVLGQCLQRGRVPAWIAPAILVAVLLPTGQWLVHFNDSEAGLNRARLFATELPVRDASEVGQLWDVLAYRAFRQHDWAAAVDASRNSVASAPSKRAQLMWAMARTFAGDYPGAESVYVALSASYPDEPIVWLGLGGVAMRMHDDEQLRRAVARLGSYGPGTPERRIVKAAARAFPEMWPPLARGLGAQGGRMPPVDSAATGSGLH